MSEQNLQLRHQSAVRRFLRIGGVVVTTTAVVLLIIGVASFFMSFGGFDPPRYFWCAFIAIPLLPIGGTMLSWGFLGVAQRYLAGETAPVGKDVFNYLGENAQPGVAAIASAVRDGLATVPPSATKPPADA